MEVQGVEPLVPDGSEHPQLAELAQQLIDGEADELRRLPSAQHGLDALWERLPER